MTLEDIGLAVVIGIIVGFLGWLMTIAGVLLNNIVPIWIAAVIGFVAFTIAIVVAAVTKIPPEPPENTGPPDIELIQEP